MEDKEEQDIMRIVARQMEESKVEHVGVDVRKAAIYLATVMEHTKQGQEGIRHLLPRRVACRGSKPMVATRELGGPPPRKDVKEEEETVYLIGDQEGSGVIGKVLDELDTEEATSKWILFPRTCSKEEKGR